MEKGMVQIYTGDGKGKTTAALGLALRAAGHHKKVYILQFLKGQVSGELKALEEIPNINLKRANPNLTKFYFQMNQKEKDDLGKETREFWQGFRAEIMQSDYDLVIIDEIMGVLANQILELTAVIDLIENKPKKQELVLTGRDAPEKLIKLADYVTEMKMIKHPYINNVPPRLGIEF